MLLVSAYWGLGLGLLTSLASAAAFNFFHIPPVGRFTIADSRNWVALAAFVTVAVVVEHGGRAGPQPGASRPSAGAREADLAAALARELLAGAATDARRWDDRAPRGRGARRCPRRRSSSARSTGDERRRAACPARRASGARSPRCSCPLDFEPDDRRAPAQPRSCRRSRRWSRSRCARDALQAEAVETAALRRSDDVKTALLRAVSHDLRTPLTAIVAAGHALGARSLTGDERSELSAAVVDEGERLSALVDKLLDLSRSQAGRAEPRPRLGVARGGRCSPRARASVRARRRVRRDRSSPTCRPCAPTPPSSSARSRTCSRTPGATRAGSPVSVHRAARQGSRVVVRVVDHGPGITPAERERGSSSPSIAAPRQRRGRGRAPASGSRSPRASSRPTAGTIAVESLPGQGTSFVVAFPLRETAPERASDERRRPRVLVCDDEPQILRALRVILRDAGFRGAPGRPRRGGARPRRRGARRDAAIVDLVLPDIDGVEVCRRLREWSEMPIIVLSAVGDEDAKVRALAAGADDYVTKPFGPRELSRGWRRTCAAPRPRPEETVISADGLEIDLAAPHRARATATRSTSRPTEFDLLRDAGAQPRPADDPSRRC